MMTMTEMNVFDALERYDQLQNEFTAYKYKIGSLRNHSKSFLIAAALEVRIKLNQLKKLPDDDYHSVASAIVVWGDLYKSIHNQLHMKCPRF